MPDPVELDTPLLNPRYTAKGWDLQGSSNEKGLIPVGYGAQIWDEIEKNKPELTVRKEGGRDQFLAEFDEKGIVVKNKTRISYINGVIVNLEERLGLLKKEEGEVKLICFICRAYKPFSELQADHFQPRSSIISRMKAYWLKLEDPDFLKEQKKNPLFSKMFHFDQRLKITQFFQRSYLHSEDNLWPLCQTCNGFQNKSNKSPLEFLRDLPLYGQPFLDSLPPLDGKGILIRANNRPLAQFAIEWFVKKSKVEIGDRQLYAQIKEEGEKKIGKDEKKTRKMMIRLEIATEDSDSSDGELDEASYRAAVRKKRDEIKREYHEQRTV